MRRARRKRKSAQELSSELVELPTISQAGDVDAQTTITKEVEIQHEMVKDPEQRVAEEAVEIMHTAPFKASIPRPETPATSLPASEDNNSTNPTTPSSVQQPTPVQGDITPVASKPAPKQVAPVIPVVPTLPKTSPPNATKAVPPKATGDSPAHPVAQEKKTGNSQIIVPTAGEEAKDEVKEEAPAVKAWNKPKLWAGLFNPNAPVSTASSENGQGALAPSGSKPSSESLAEALRSFNAVSTDKVAFLEPRGLVNTGNMCYMNSVSRSCYPFYAWLTSVQVLQVLVFCGPFFNFLDQVSKRAVHSFKSETPLIDAM